MAISPWQAKAERAIKAFKRFREQTDSNVVHARHDLESIGAGAAAGLIRGAFEGTGKVYAIPLGKGVSFPPEMAIGGVLAALAFSGQTDATSDLHALSAGVLSFGAGHQACEWMKRKKAAAAAPAQAAA